MLRIRCLSMFGSKKYMSTLMYAHSWNWTPFCAHSLNPKCFASPFKSRQQHACNGLIMQVLFNFLILFYSELHHLLYLCDIFVFYHSFRLKYLTMNNWGSDASLNVFHSLLMLWLWREFSCIWSFRSVCCAFIDCSNWKLTLNILKWECVCQM